MIETKKVACFSRAKGVNKKKHKKKLRRSFFVGMKNRGRGVGVVNRKRKADERGFV